MLTDKVKDEIIEFLTGRLQEKRLKHSFGVMNMAVKLAKAHNVDEDEAMLAGLLHDCAKNMTNDELLQYCKDNGIEVDEIKRQSPGILHADVGAHIAKNRFGVNDNVYRSILLHTLASADMSDLDKIIYLADLVEEGRELDGIDEIREVAFDDLDKALFMALTYCIENVKQVGKTIHEQSIQALNAAKSRCNQ